MGIGKVRYYKNGEEVEKEQIVNEDGERRLNEMLASHTPPGGHEPYWGTGFESFSSAIPSAQAAEHAAWIKEQGLVGVEVCKSSDLQGMTTVKTSSPENKRKYLEARGLADYSSAGSGSAKGTGGSISSKRDTNYNTETKTERNKRRKAKSQ